MDRIETLRELAKTTTPGPWTIYEKERYFYVKGSGEGHTYMFQRRKYLGNGEDLRIRSDCQWIAAASPDYVLKLLEVVDKARAWAAVASLRDEYKQDEEHALLAALDALEK